MISSQIGIEYNSNMITKLTKSQFNKRLIIHHIAAGFNATKRLSELGIMPGTEIIILTQAPFQGPLQIEVRGTRLALGHGLSEKIFVWDPQMVDCEEKKKENST